MRVILLLFSGLALLVSLAARMTLSAPPQEDDPETAVEKMRPAEGFTVRLVASEPLERKPVALEFDDRSRPWVIQYLQYPNPAGLKRVRVDRYSRTVYDRVPEPPPRGPKGADRITILAEMNREGRATKTKDFVSDLNLATGLAFGHGGVFVLQVPYLLFYPDRDGDDVPDGPPDVLLSGFGMEDASSVANSLTWGPDGVVFFSNPKVVWIAPPRTPATSPALLLSGDQFLPSSLSQLISVLAQEVPHRQVDETVRAGRGFPEFGK
jgi:hypothetical protein